MPPHSRARYARAPQPDPRPDPPPPVFATPAGAIIRWDFPGGWVVDRRQTTVRTVKELIAEARRVSACLIVVAGNGEVGRSFRLEKDECLIGRSEDADVCLDDEGVSRHHCLVTVRPDGSARVEDLGSTNGTFRNGERIQACDLYDGDKVQIGSSAVLKFAYQDHFDEELLNFLYDASTRDPLTGAFNKRYLVESLEKDIAFARRHQTPLSIILFDLDHFKRVNDTWGHLAGDFVLKRVVEVLGAAIRGEDVFARYGGEEFVLVARDCTLERATALADRLRAGVEGADFVFEGARIAVTVSAGVGTTDGIGIITADELLAEADRCLYQAKDAGRNCVVPPPGEPTLPPDVSVLPHGEGEPPPVDLAQPADGQGGA